MTNEEMARSYLVRAAQVLEEAETDYRDEAWNLVVRRSQEAVELALKGCLRWVGLEVPRVHDVGRVVKRHRRRLRGRIAEEIDRVAAISRTLGKQREVSFYGDEKANVPPEQLYTQQDAVQVLQDAKWVLSVCEELLSS